jgi:hypothetical protein
LVHDDAPKNSPLSVESRRSHHRDLASESVPALNPASSLIPALPVALDFWNFAGFVHTRGERSRHGRSTRDGTLWMPLVSRKPGFADRDGKYHTLQHRLQADCTGFGEGFPGITGSTGEGTGFPRESPYFRNLGFAGKIEQLVQIFFFFTL